MTFILPMLLVSLGIIFYFWSKQRKIQSEMEKIGAEYKESQAILAKLSEEVKELEKYRGVLNAELKAQEILTQANLTASEMDQKSNENLKQSTLKSSGIIDAAELEAKNILSSAKKDASDVRVKAETNYQESMESSKKIISEAEIEAKKIAGSAYEAMTKAEFYEKTAKAMKNIIEGYGDQYIIPTFTLIDHLADDYSHTLAGEELKKARERMRKMIKDGIAAECDYVESNRKETAIDFVLDAFNGKVDTIMASVKEDNYGTLSQKIKDAFQTVNANGAAFRNARIAEAYLQTRLDELKLASTVQALKEKEREEQRRIREQIREEEKAVKEYERALKEVQKEEETVAKAMEKVKKELETANDQKRLIFEEKLKELELKLKEAEEKNKRVQSMAELTKSGHVYIISNIGSFGEDILKIGMTRRLDPLDRIYELGDASVPFEFDVHAMIYSEDAPALEKVLHRKFAEVQVNKVNPRKEFFKMEIAKIKAEVEQMGISIHWTMVAEAREFRESATLAKVTRKAA